MGYFNPLSAALGAFWQKPLNYADTLRVNKGAEETSRPNDAEPKEKTESLTLVARQSETYTAPIDTIAEAENPSVDRQSEIDQTYAPKTYANSYEARVANKEAVIERAMSDFGFSKRVAQSFVSARGALSEEAAKTFAQTADAFFKEFIDGRNLTEATMNYLKALNVVIAVLF